MKIKHTYFSLITVILGIFIITGFTSTKSFAQTKGNKDIIKFSHKTHADIGDCVTCHSSVDSSKSLSDIVMPNHDICQNCHDVTDKKNCTKCHYDGVYKPLVKLKTSLKFNHSFHLKQQKLKCTDCHKGIFDTTYAEVAPKGFPTMETCTTCHNNISVATNNCTTCHTSSVGLIPQSHKDVSFLQNHKFAARKIDANCSTCHSTKITCQDCHNSTNTITENNTVKNFFAPYSPAQPSSGVKQQKLTRVHSLNYVYTHGIDAMAQTVECQSCHQLDTFCAKCHQGKNEDYSLGGIAPLSHLKPNFVIAGGYGSGGGEHATLARRDIESCAACHDVQGGDPVCIKCHTDPDGIQGTNPRTHPPNYMKDVYGDWHNSQSSICYNCHTSQSPSSPAGVGFCGYCHGANPH